MASATLPATSRDVGTTREIASPAGSTGRLTDSDGEETEWGAVGDCRNPTPMRRCANAPRTRATPLRAPQAALLEARTDLPGLGLSVRASADVSQISVRAFAGLAGALALLLCCVGVLCAALCWAVLARRARYESYRVINPARPL